MNNSSNARYKESRVEKDSQTQTQGYVSRFEHQALHLRLHRMKDFYYFHKEISQRVQTLILCTRGDTKPMDLYTKGGHKVKKQSQYTKQIHL